MLRAYKTLEMSNLGDERASAKILRGSGDDESEGRGRKVGRGISESEGRNTRVQSCTTHI